MSQNEEKIKAAILALHASEHTVEEIVNDVLGDCKIFSPLCEDVLCRDCPLFIRLNETETKKSKIKRYILAILEPNGNPIINDVMDELARADAKYPDDPMSMDELMKSFYTINSELVELHRECVRVKIDTVKMRKEAVQVAAMAIKFIRDVCP